MHFDYKSVLFFLIINNIFIIILFLYFLLNKNLKKWFLVFYLIGKTFQTLSFVGIALRDYISPFFSVQVSNFFLISCFALNAFAVLSFDGKFRAKIFYLYALFVFIFFGWFAFNADNGSFRLVIQILASIFFFGSGALFLLRQKEKYNFLYFISGTFILYSVFQIFRAYIIYNSGQEYNFFHGAGIDSLNFIVSAFAMNVTSIGFLFLLLEVNARVIENKNLLIEKDHEDLKILNQTKDKFFSIIAHDLRGPIGTMSSLLDLIKEEYNDKLDEKVLKAFNILNSTSKQTFSLLENLLTWARSHSGNIKYNPVKQNIQTIIQNNFRISDATAREKNIKLINQIPDNCFGMVDSEMTDTIVRNLLTNAIKYTPDNGTITVSSRKNNNFIEISIQDTGIGISQQILEKLFHINERNVSTKGTKGEKGTGLGLILCKEFTEKQGGKIWVESKVETGSVFYFSVPVFIESQT